MLSRIHNGHVGIQGCLRGAKESLYWPRMYRDIENLVRNCESCNVYQNEQVQEPLTQHEIPDRPWEKPGIDLFEFRNKNYLVTVDYYSSFFEVDRLYKTTSKHVIQKWRAQFSKHGIPSKVNSGNLVQVTLQKSRLNSETIWKLWKKSRLNTE